MQSVLEDLRLWDGDLDDLVSQWIGVLAIQMGIALGAPLWAMIAYSDHLLASIDTSDQALYAFCPYSANCMGSKFTKDDSEHEQHHGVILMRHILSAAHFAGRCRISARACNRFDSTAFLAVRALSFSDRAKL